MPEFKKGNQKISEGFLPCDVDVNKIAYQKKDREKQRQVKLRKDKAMLAAAGPSAESSKKAGPAPTVAWSHQLERKANKEKRQARKAFQKRKRDEVGSDDERGTCAPALVSQK